MRQEVKKSFQTATVGIQMYAKKTSWQHNLSVIAFNTKRAAAWTAPLDEKFETVKLVWIISVIVVIIWSLK